MTTKLLATCWAFAQRHIPKHPQFHYYPHYSYIIQDNQLIEWGTNQDGNPPLYFGYHSRVTVPKLHSELVCYRKARGLLDKSRPYEMVNIRLNRRGVAKIAAPCPCCQEWLISTGCSAVWFTTSTQRFGKIKL